MPPAPYAESLRRFARDLSALRESQGVTIERIHQQSKIPLHVLQDFEADALLGNPVFNRVYLRSLVKTYADSLRVPIGEVLSALESAYAGEAKSLRYLGPRSLDATADAPLETPPTTPNAAVDDPPEANAAVFADGATADEQVDEAPDATSDAAFRTSIVPAEAATAAAPEDVPVVLPDPVSPEPPPPAAPEVTPAAAHPVPPILRPDPVSPAGRAFTGGYADVETRRLPSWLPVALGVVALLALIGGLLWWLGRDPQAADRTAAAPAADVPADTAAARPAPTAPSAPIALPDTLVLTIRATTEPLRGIRLRRDDDVRRPYWIEAGSEQTFAFLDSAFVDAAGSPTAAYLLNGAPLDAATVRAADGTLVLVRDRLARR